MDRVTLSVTPENFITIAIMAIGGWLIVGSLWQVAKKYVPNLGGNSSAGEATGDY